MRFVGFVALGIVAAFAAPSAFQDLSLSDIRMPAGAGPLPVAFASNTGMPICSGGDRAGRGLTCIVDGDTGWENGVKWRLTTRTGGVDTPEISQPECSAESAAGYSARDRLRQLMAPGYEIDLGNADRYGRALAVVTLADGRDAGDVLISEGLAQPWPNEGNPWCGR